MTAHSNVTGTPGEQQLGVMEQIACRMRRLFCCDSLNHDHGCPRRDSYDCLYRSRLRRHLYCYAAPALMRGSCRLYATVLFQNMSRSSPVRNSIVLVGAP